MVALAHAAKLKDALQKRTQKRENWQGREEAYMWFVQWYNCIYIYMYIVLYVSNDSYLQLSHRIYHHSDAAKRMMPMLTLTTTSATHSRASPLEV